MLAAGGGEGGGAGPGGQGGGGGGGGSSGGPQVVLDPLAWSTAIQSSRDLLQVSHPKWSAARSVETHVWIAFEQGPKAPSSGWVDPAGWRCGLGEVERAHRAE
eukprot:1161461-Pelagomonas_calceolata.AAC.2